MKKLYFSALLSLLSILSYGSSFHFNGSSSLFLSLYDQSSFWVEFDGSPQSFYGQFFQLQNIAPGLHHFRVTQKSAAYYGSRRFYSERIVFQGTVNLEANTEVTAMIDDFQNFRVTEKRILSQANRNYYSPSCCDSYQSGCRHHCSIITHHSRTGNPHCQQSHCCSVGNRGNTYYPEIQVSIKPEDFRVLLNTLSKTSFESSKKEIAKQAIGFNFLTSDQAKQLVSTFTFESSKVEIAKAAYPRTIDKERYFVVNDAFNFSSSISELNRHIAGFR